MAVFVLVHGGGHGGWCYAKVARRLRAAGHTVHAPSLTGLGDRSHLLGPGIDLNLHVQDVVNLLHYEDLRDVVLVGHSYGGMVITGVGDRAGDRVGTLVYLDAANPVDGESLVDGLELVLLPDPQAGRFYGVEDPDDLAWMAERLTPQPWLCFEQPLRLQDPEALAAIPQWHIVCTSTLATRDPDLMERARSQGRLRDIDTGHDLMITEPDAVARALIEVVAA